MAGDRRYERRVPKHDWVDVRFRETDGAEAQLIARLRDLSKSGASLEVERPLRMATVIGFEHGGRGFKASVRYCTKTPSAFVIGVEFDDSLA